MVENDTETFALLAEKMLSSADDLLRLRAVWGEKMTDWLLEIRARSSELRIKLLDSAKVQYSRAANYWLDEILEKHPDLGERPVYFVSSNMQN